MNLDIEEAVKYLKENEGIVNFYPDKVYVKIEFKDLKLDISENYVNLIEAVKDIMQKVIRNKKEIAEGKLSKWERYKEVIHLCGYMKEQNFGVCTNKELKGFNFMVYTDEKMNEIHCKVINCPICGMMNRKNGEKKDLRNYFLNGMGDNFMRFFRVKKNCKSCIEKDKEIAQFESKLNEIKHIVDNYNGVNYIWFIDEHDSDFIDKIQKILENR